jgi:hypothetical protein
MTIQQTAYRGGRQTAPPRAVARAIPVPSEYEAFRRYRADYCRKAALVNRRAANDVAPTRAKPAVRAESRVARALTVVDNIAMSLMSAYVLALLPFAASLLLGLV